MKFLSIVALGLTLLMAPLASALDICPTGSLADFEATANTPDTYIADNCNMSSYIKLIAFAPESTSSTNITVQNSYFQSAGYLSLYFDGVAAVIVTVKSNYFSHGAYVSLNGTLPVNSSITIQGNQMLTHSYAITSDSYHFVILSNSVINIIDNNVSVSNPNNEGNEGRAISLKALELHDSSSVNVLRNKFSANGLVWDSLINIIAVNLTGVNSSLRVEENTFFTDTRYGVNGLHVAGVTGDRSAVFSFSDNVLSISTSEINYYYPLNLNKAVDVTLLVDNNQISYNTATAMFFEEMDSLAGFSISNNTIQSTNASITSDIMQLNLFAFYPNSSYAVTNNKVSAPSVTTTDAHLINVDTYTPAYNSTLLAGCGNSLPWSANPTFEQLFSAEILPAVNLTQCPRASALDICPTGSLADFEATANTPDTFIADNCNISSYIKLNAFAPESTSSTNITVQNSYFQSAGYLSLYFDGVAAVIVTVKSNYFSHGAYVSLNGTLPVNSSITIQGNQILTHSYAITSDSYHFVILSNSVINIIDNNVSVSNPNNEGNEGRAISLKALELHDSSSVNVLRNKFSANGLVWDSLINIIAVNLTGVNSSLRVEENIFFTDTRYGVNGLKAEYVSGDRSAVFSFSDNVLSISTSEINHYYPLNLNTVVDVTLLVDNNQISYNTATAIFLEELNSLAGFSISNNTIQSTNASITSDIMQINLFAFYPNSSYAVTNNKVSAPSVTTTDAHLLNVDTYTPAYNSTLLAGCGNSLPWSANPTFEQLFSAEILPAVNVTQCPEITSDATSEDTTSQDTTSQYTTSDNTSETTVFPSSSRLNSVFVAVTLCLLAYVFVFTF